MPNTERREIEEITAVDDDNEEYIVVITDEFMEHRGRDANSPGGVITRWIPAKRIEIRLDDGTPVNRIDADTFEIATTRVRIKRVK